MVTIEKYSEELENWMNANETSRLPDIEYVAAGGVVLAGAWWLNGGLPKSLAFNPPRQCGFVIFTNVNGILGGKEDVMSVWENLVESRRA
jgi:hypothetical protein